MLHVGLREAQVLQDENAITYIYDLLANVAFETGQFRKAEDLFLLVIKRLFAQGISMEDVKVLHISLKLANIYEHTGDKEKAESGYQYCVENIPILLDKDPENKDILILLAMTYDWYAKMLESLGRYADAYKYLEQSYDICVKVHGKFHEQTVYLLNTLGVVSYLMQDYDKSIEYLTTAIEIGRALPDMVSLGLIHVNLGDAYLKKGLYAEAKKACTNGRIIAKSKEDNECLAEANICLENIKKVM
ncbi:PREDICTED: tetratricopeptide repeat protein 19 homolog, mitochondrial isoform X2 [Polistes dominula]|nr:PREDICTED: tetratricopeptide repeat protein 19 homolog, mitochondrial isoform X2 [Polistes dominula]